MHVRSIALVLCGTLGGASCSGSTTSSKTKGALDDSSEGDAVGDVSTGEDIPVADDVAAQEDPRPPAICRAGPFWSPGMPAFSDVSEAAGLRKLGVNGIRLSSADLDGDGDPELVTRSMVIGGRDDFGGAGPRFTFVLRNDGGVFTDITESSGLLAPRTGVGGRTAHIAVFGDVNNDGRVDAVMGVNPGTDPSKDNGDRTEVLLATADGRFELAPGGDVRAESQLWPVNAVVLTDADRDGNLDVFTAIGTDAEGYPLPDRLYRGDGQGAFEDVTTEFGFVYSGTQSLIDALNSANTDKNSWGALAADLNGDGSADIVTASYGRAMNGLWLSEGSTAWHVPAPHLTVAMDDDLDWTTNYNAQCYCTLNPNAEDCDGVPAPPDFFGCAPGDTLRWNHSTDREPFRLGGNTFTHATGDLDADGDLDLVETDIVHWDVGSSSDPSQVLLNDGEGRFTRTQILSGDHTEIAWNDGDMTAAIFDFDSDGREDIYIGSSDYPGTRGRLYHQGSDGSFTLVPDSAGLSPARSQGLTTADFDGDGDLDVAVGHGTARCSGDPSCLPTAEVRLFRNDTPRANQLAVRLIGGKGSNRSAIGARVRVTTGDRTQTQELGGGYGHYGLQNDLSLHFGLGEACEIDVIEVRWPDLPNTIERFEAVRGNYRVTLTQGEGLQYGAPL